MDSDRETVKMKCYICERGCTIPAGKTGACGLYQNDGENIKELFPNKYLTVCPISIETMPILHFHPGGKFFQISTTGCNFNCPGCFSTVIAREMDHTSPALRELSPQQVVNETIKNNCIGIAFLLNDPLASFPTFLKVAATAQKSGLLVGCSSNSYFTESSLAEISPHLDFINVGVKGFSARAYQECGGSTVKPVLRNIARFYESGIHVEVSCILQKKNMEEIMALAESIADISPEIPFQLMRYIPLEGADPALEPSIWAAEALYHSLKEKLNYVYLFNSPGTDYLNTFCPSCGEMIYKRDFYGPMGAKLLLPKSDSAGNVCPHCGQGIPVKAPPAETKYQEGDFEGGYPFTRALEMIEAILIAMGVTNIKKVVQVWEIVLSQKGLPKLHRDIQNISSYFETIRYFGQLIGMEKQAARLVSYMEDKVSLIQQSLPPAEKKPRVYYIMGKPLFCLMGERFENQLVEAAGGISANKELECSGRPGNLISVAELNALNPEVIFVSAFLSSSVEEVYAECCHDGINIEAVRNKRIYAYPAAGWDFGSPRWILGLLYMANRLHPGVYQFDVQAEAERFYKQFYGINFSPEEVNRSFSKPSKYWQWQNE